MALVDYGGVKNGYEQLCAEVLRIAYNDMLDAMLAHVAHDFRQYSYNCAMYYELLRKNKRRGKYGVDKDSRIMAKIDADRMMKWFRYSKQCAIFCKTVQGAYFVDIAEKHVIAFALDQKPEWQIRPTFGVIENPCDLREERRKVEAWKQRRDEWREKHGKEKIE